MTLANLTPKNLTVARLSSALGIPVIAGSMAANSGTMIEVQPRELDAYRPLMTDGSLAVVDRSAGVLLVRLGETSTWLLASAGEPDESGADDEEDDPLLLDAPTHAFDAERGNRVAARIAQAPGFGAVARKPAFRDDFARPYVLDWYDANATDWHVGEIAHRARNLWEFGVLPREAKAMHAAGESFRSIARALGVAISRAKWAVELPHEHSMIDYL